MKIRTGFVSNSSSSSFIITINEVTNKELFIKHLRKPTVLEFDEHAIIDGMTDFYEKIDNISYLMEDMEWCGFAYPIDNLDKMFEKNPKLMLFIKTNYGLDGDYHFWNEEWECMDYDKITLGDFPEEDRKMYVGEFPGLKPLVTHFGAGRNG